MRQGQQNRRGRGRNNGNRKGQNPLTRSYESNGPDVKVRGTPAHIAEKYISLARDAQSSGDPVLAENYLQHAEHYNRIIMTYREQMHQSGEMMNGGFPRHRPMPGEGDELASEEGDDGQLDSMGQPIRGQEPQPSMLDSPSPMQQQPGGFQQPQPHQHQHQREHRGQRFDDRGHRRHGEHGGRPHRERFQEQREFREAREPRGFAADRPPPAEPMTGQEPSPPTDRAAKPERGERTDSGSPRRREPFAQPPHEQPEFLRRPVRRPRREGSNGNGAEEGDAAPAAAPGGGDDPSRE
jgi:hypothetical protein